MKINNKIIKLKRYTKLLFYCKRSVAILVSLVLVLSLGIAALPIVGTVEAWCQPNPIFMAIDTSGETSTKIDIGWSSEESKAGSHSVHIETTEATTDYAMVGVETNFILLNTTQMSYWGYTVAGSGVNAPDEIWLEFENGKVICNTHPGGTSSQWVEWTLSGSSNWYTPSLSPTSVTLSDYYDKTVTKIFLGAGSPTSTGVAVDVYLDNLIVNDTTLLDDDTGEIDVFCGTFCGYTGNTGIQVAINAALPGDTINVAAGTYDEQVVINKSLTLQGEGDTTIVKPFSGDKLTYHVQHPTDGSNYYTGVIVVETGGVNVTVKDLKIDAENITNLNDAYYYTGITYFDTGGVIDDITVANVLKRNPAQCDFADGIHVKTWSHNVSIEIKNCTVQNSGGNNIILKENTGTDLTGIVHYNNVEGRGSQNENLQNGILFYNGVSGTISNNTISDVRWELFSSASPWTSSGILCINPDGSTANAIVSNNTITNADCGINGTGELVIDNNSVTGGYVGVGIGAEGELEMNSAVTIENNTVTNATEQGISLLTYDTDVTVAATIQGNTIYGGGGAGTTGIALQRNFANLEVESSTPVDGTLNATISQNKISGWDEGISIGEYSDTIVVNENDINGNLTYGLTNSKSSAVDATNNWWGDASGPSGGVADPVTGKIADGNGDAVSSKVKFDPFLSPNVTITKTGPTTANQGNNITYTITYKNEGTFNATNVVITETYPSEVEFVSANPVPSIGNKQWNIGTLAPNGEGTITVTVHIK